MRKIFNNDVSFDWRVVRISSLNVIVPENSKAFLVIDSYPTYEAVTSVSRLGTIRVTSPSTLDKEPFVLPVSYKDTI